MNLDLFASKHWITGREKAVISLLLSGTCTNKSIAAELNISPNTVKEHFHNVYYKLGVNSKPMLLAKIFAEKSC